TVVRRHPTGGAVPAVGPGPGHDGVVRRAGRVVSWRVGTDEGPGRRVVPSSLVGRGCVDHGCGTSAVLGWEGATLRSDHATRRGARPPRERPRPARVAPRARATVRPRCRGPGSARRAALAVDAPCDLA